MTKTVRVFRNGGSLAVRVPKEWLGGACEVELSRRGEEIVLTPKARRFEDFLREMRKMGKSELPRRRRSRSGVRARL